MRRLLILALAVALLLALFAQMALGSRRLSLTYDEPIYVALGYADLTTGDVSWHGVNGHPPLINLLTAWPLLLGSAHPNARQVAGWGSEDLLGFSCALLEQLGPLERVALLTRLPVMGLTLLLAAFVYRWARRLGGGWAGLLALALLAFDPNIIAHGQLNTHDLGVTAFGFMSCYALVRYLRRPSHGLYLATGLALGATLASKASGAFWIGAFGVIVLLAGLSERTTPDSGHRTSNLRAWLVRWTGWVGLALLVLWASYLFEVRPLTDGGFPVPAASHWLGLVYQRSNLTAGQTTFLAGRLVSGGHWSYFPLAFLLKTPLPTLVLCGATAACCVFRVAYRVSQIADRRSRTATPASNFQPPTSNSQLPPSNLQTWPSLLVVPLLYFPLSMLAGLNIGYRHILPVLPFLFVLVSPIAYRLSLIAHRPRTTDHATRNTQHVSRFTLHASRFTLCALLLWLIIGTLLVFPNSLTYFNELAGGPDGGYRYLADSNVDWGQALLQLEDYLDEQQVDEARLAAFSSLDPALYGLRFEPLPPTLGAPITLTARFNPAPGRYIISAAPLQGVWLLDPDTYDWFRHREPIDRVGHALMVYEVTPPDPTPSWVAQCTAPVPPLTAAQVAEGFGRGDLRLATFDCVQGWLYPPGAGWIVLPGDAEPDAWGQLRLAGVSLSFRQGQLWDHPAVDIYAQQGTMPGAVPPQTGGHAAPSAWPPGQVLAEGMVVSAPLRLDGPLSFLGYQVSPEPGGVELDTFWRVEDVSSRPLSLMGHLVAADGASVVVSDGLSVPIETWQPGDVIVQRHWLAFPDGGAGPYWLQTGAYWLDTMERWFVQVEGQAAGNRLLLVEVTP